jgi:acyl-coenzyme A synthetase/AMP-(fatty) acid ligase
MEVETFLNTINDVEESLVTLTRNSDKLELLTAFVCVSQRKAKMISNHKMVDEFRDNVAFECGKKFAFHKRPELIFVLGKFPENPNNGKIFKKVLVEYCNDGINVEDHFGILFKET